MTMVLKSNGPILYRLLMSVIQQDACKLSSFAPLKGLAKTKCPGCDKRRMYFCYDCHTLLPDVFSPHIKLPCDVDIIKHPMEKNSKSSAIHCKIVTPEQTRIFNVPDVYDYTAEASSSGEGSNVLVFPSPSAVSIEEFVRTKGSIKRFVVLDCTWFQVHMMQKIPQIQGLPCVSLTNYKTAFWRPQHNVGEFDDLLFWFFHTRQYVDKRQEEYQKRRRESAEANTEQVIDS